MLTSSGTTGDVSRIYLDREAAAAQTRMLARTLQAVLGPRRLPMLVVDTPRRRVRPHGPSAPGAPACSAWSTSAGTTSGSSTSDGEPDPEAVRGFLAEHGDQPFLVFGFTFMVWLYLYELARDHGLDLSQRRS